MYETNLKTELLDEIITYFINSSDFNGLHLFKYATLHKISENEIKKHVNTLLQEKEIDLAFESVSQNPHIKRIDDLPINKQIELLQNEPLKGICAYPKSHHIKRKIDLSKYDDYPFTKMLWLVQPQLKSIYFELPVLEKYFRDARYEFDFKDFSGQISVKTEHYDSNMMKEKDKIFLQTFGIGYDENKNRVVISYLRYLARLSSEHQVYWNSQICNDNCIPNSDYYKATIYGILPKFLSIYNAFLREQIEINKLCGIINKPPLFKNTYTENRPEGFHALLNPTKKNYFSFIHLLDKLISDNINYDFFEDDIEREEIKKHSDGTIEKIRINSLRLLENWLRKYYKVPDNVPSISESFKPFREIRKLRQKPAHKIEDDEYNMKYVQEQKRILQDAYHRLKLIRLIFSKHPYANDYSPPNWLTESKIVFY